MNGNPTANCQGSNWIDCYQTLPISGVTWKEWPIEKAKTSAQKKWYWHKHYTFSIYSWYVYYKECCMYFKYLNINEHKLSFSSFNDLVFNKEQYTLYI